MIPLLLMRYANKIFSIEEVLLINHTF